MLCAAGNGRALLLQESQFSSDSSRALTSSLRGNATTAGSIALSVEPEDTHIQTFPSPLGHLESFFFSSSVQACPLRNLTAVYLSVKGVCKTHQDRWLITTDSMGVKSCIFKDRCRWTWKVGNYSNTWTHSCMFFFHSSCSYFGWSALFAVCGAVVMYCGLYNESMNVQVHLSVSALHVRTYATSRFGKILTPHVGVQFRPNDSHKCIVMDIMTGVVVIVVMPCPGCWSGRLHF